MRWIMGCLVLLATLTSTSARDLGQWEDSDPQIRLWFQGLLQPDNLMSCCGEADAYWADEVKVKYNPKGEAIVIAVITDDRDDEPLRRAHVPIGTEYIVPENKVLGRRKEGNPVGHTIIFLGTMSWPPDSNTERVVRGRPVLCYVMGIQG